MYNVYFIDITLINVSGQGILLLFEAAYKYIYPPTHQKKNIYICFFLMLSFIIFGQYFV